MKQFKIQFVFDILLLLVCLHFAVSAIFDLWLKNYIVSKVNSQTSGSQLEIKHLHVSLFSRCIELKNVSYILDTSAVFNSESINVSGISIGDLRNKIINVASLETKNSHLSITLIEKKDTASKPATPSGEMLKAFKKCNIGKIDLSNLNLKIEMIHGNKKSTTFFNASLIFNEFKIDSSSAFADHKLFDALDGSITLTDFKRITDDSLYTLTSPLVNFSYSDAKVTMDSLRLEPNYSKKEFAQIAGMQCDRFIMYTKQIAFDSIDVKSFIENGTLFSSSLNIDSMHLMAYRSKYVKDVPMKKKFIRHLVTDLKMPLKIENILVKNSYVEYEELTPPSTRPGKIFFTKINASIKNVSNLPVDSNAKVLLHATGSLNNTSPIDNRLQIYLNRDFVEGTVSAYNINMPNINEVIEASIGAEITNGIVDSLFYNLSSDGHFIRGPFKFFYHDLRVAVKDVRENDTMQTQLRFKSFLANTFIIKKRNPDKDKPVRVVDINIPYGENKFLLSNLWHSMMGGIKNAVGIP